MAARVAYPPPCPPPQGGRVQNPLPPCGGEEGEGGATPRSQQKVCVGQIVAAQGIRGDVRIKAFTAEPASVAAYGPVSDESGRRTFRVRVTEVRKDVVVAHLDGVSDRDAAEALRGVRLYVPRDALPAPEADEFYHADLIGLRAELADGAAFGTVAALHDFGAGDILEIARPGGATAMLPFTREVVPTVDLAGGRIVVDPPGEDEGDAA